MTQNLKQKLSTLIDEFGYDGVRKTLAAIRRQASPKKRATQPLARAPRAPRPRKTAIAVVKTIDPIDTEKRELLLVMATEFEDKRFMPNVNHARAFLARIGKDPSRIKSRQQVISPIFKGLAAMDIDALRAIENSGIYGPPKRLATYARAIGDFGRDRRASQ